MPRLIEWFHYDVLVVGSHSTLTEKPLRDTLMHVPPFSYAADPVEPLLIAAAS